MKKIYKFKQLNKKIRLNIITSYLITLLGVAIMLVSIFLPYMNAVGEFAEYIKENPRVIEDELLSIRAEDYQSIHIFYNRHIFISLYKNFQQAYIELILYIVIILSALTCVFCVFKKAMSAMVFNLLGIATFICFIYNTNRFFSKNSFAPGIGFYALLIAQLIIFFGSLWMLTTENMIYRQLNPPENEKTV